VYLTALFVLLLLARPFLPITILSRVFNAGVLASAWLAGPRRRSTRLVLAIFSVVSALSIAASFFGPGALHAYFRPALSVSLGLLTIFFLVFCAVLLLTALLRKHHVMAEDMLGAVNLYLILGFAWAQIYTLLEIAMPGSFRLPVVYGSVPVERYYELAASKFIYFSFITQATQGYGDVVPLSTAAETLVILQTTIGQLYVALVVAYLLSVHVTQRMSKA
jgi:hypothetical protein